MKPLKRNSYFPNPVFKLVKEFTESLAAGQCGCLLLVALWSSGCATTSIPSESVRISVSPVKGSIQVSTPSNHVNDSATVPNTGHVQARKHTMLVALKDMKLTNISPNPGGMPKFSFEPTTGRFVRHSQKASHGTLTPVTEDGYFLTAYHVIKGTEQLKAISHDEFGIDSTPARVVWTSKQADLALVHAPLTISKPLAWCSSNLSNNSKVTVDRIIGKDQKGKLLQRVFVKRLSKTNRRFQQIFHTAMLYPGNSGGPLVNKKGELIAINVATITVATENSGSAQISKSVRPDVSMIKRIIQADRRL